MKLDIPSYLLGTTMSAGVSEDLSDATATPADILSPKTAYLANGKKKKGTIPSIEENIYTPSTTDQTISAGQYLAGDQIIEGDPNLTADNIRENKSIFGVVGTYNGDQEYIDPDKPIKFIDYDGTILYSYTPQEFSLLTELPTNPAHERLISQGWNWTLADAKEQVSSTGEIIIGQLYTTKSGATEIDVKLTNVTLHPYLYINALNSVTVEINWGDNSSSETYTTSSSIWANHTYAVPGNYTIRLLVTSGTLYLNFDSFICYKETSKSVDSTLYPSTIQAFWSGENFQLDVTALSICNQLKYLTVNPSITGSSLRCASLQAFVVPNSNLSLSVGLNFSNAYSIKIISLPKYYSSIAAQDANSLQNVTLPNSTVSLNSQSTFRYCNNLKHIVVPSSITTLPTYCFGSCRSLSSVILSEGLTTINSSAFALCSALQSITIPSTVTTINSCAFSSCTSLGEIHFTSSTPPVLNAYDVFYNLPTPCTIYVPTGSLSAYTSATNYPSSSTYTYVEE